MARPLRAGAPSCATIPAHRSHRLRGVFSRPEHKLAGESYVDRVLVLDAAKGGVATAWMLHEMKARGVVPAALVLNAVNPIMVQGAAFADFTTDERRDFLCSGRHGTKGARGGAGRKRRLLRPL